MSRASEKSIRRGAYGISSVAGVRELNEDSCIVRDFSGRRAGKYRCLLAVADGMGGHNAGEVASSYALELLAEAAGPGRFESVDDFNKYAPVFLQKVFFAINKRIYDFGQSSDDRKGMGTTLTCLLVGYEKAFLGHVGDSRAYLFSSRGISQISQDQTVVADMVKKGLITEQEAKVHKDRNIITQAIGPQPEIEVIVREVFFREGDIFLLCSDGLYDRMDDREIADILLSGDDLETACDRLVNRALELGSSDNITAVAWQVPFGDKQGARGKFFSKMGRGKTASILLVLLLLVIMAVAGLGAGWGVGSLVSGKTDQVEQKSGGKPGDNGSGFSSGETVRIKLENPGGTYQLRAEPGGAVVASLPDGCPLEVLSGEKEQDGYGWYRVKVTGQAADIDGKTGYARSDYLEGTSTGKDD